MRPIVLGIMLAGLSPLCSEARGAEAAATSSAARSDAEQADRELRVGDAAPEFENLIGTDDKRHSLEEYAKAKAVVVVFTCNSCPVARAYEDRLMALQNEYADKGVRLVAINVNNTEADRLPAMKKRAEEQGFEFAYLYDPSQEIARKYGATVTPHVFLLDEKRQLAYVGPVDDNQNEAKVKHKYLREAIDAELAGSKPETTQHKPFGCAIKYE